ncbi:hypothetical protein IDH18_03115 [Pelagibacterales bacterium SAG-MED41]|nr:hypothetical protein [Pelagibacterales bacterium SAG-MED41]
MIITCNCGEKKFSLPDNSIPVAGRMVQCGFCGIKWKQFPPQNLNNETIIDKKISSPVKKPVTKISKPKTKKVKKPREINLYSPEYLQKKHGISLNNVETNKKLVGVKKVSFGFYSSLLLFLIVIISISRGLYFFQDFIIQAFPVTEFYLNYFFESMRNMFEIFKNLISNY